MMQISNCRSCGAAVLWAQTENGKVMPVDPAPHPDGNLVLTSIGGGFQVRVDKAAPGEKHRSHFVTCPNAEQHRRRTTTSA